MKKILLTGLALVMLCGCGNTTANNSKTCSIDQDGANIDISVTAPDGENINQIEILQIINEDHIKEKGYGENLAAVEAQLEDMNAFFDAMETEGFAIDLAVKESALHLTMNLDMSKMDQNQISQLGIDFGDTTTLEAFVKSIEEKGGTCK